MRKYRILAMLLTFTMLLTLTVWAGAQTFREGVPAAGLITAGETSPIIVERLNLTFDIQAVPKNPYSSNNAMRDADSIVTAEYTFHNPTENVVTVRTLFPFEIDASYKNKGDSVIKETVETLPEFRVWVNGETVEPTLRHSYYDQFDLEELRRYLVDGWAEDPFYDPEMTATKYTYQVLAGDFHQEDSILDDWDWVEVCYSADPARTRLYLDSAEYVGGTIEDFVLGTYYGMGGYEQEGMLFSLYVIGEPLAEEPVWSVVSTAGTQNTLMDVPVELVSTEELTLKDLFCRNWSPDYAVSESDWYNAVLFKIKQAQDTFPFFGVRDKLDVSYDLACWYEYELTLEPGESLVYTISGVIYPTIKVHANPYEYEYTYLFPSEQEWASFGELNIAVNTPFKMVYPTTMRFGKTDTGYSLSRDGLPDMKLGFSLRALKDSGSSDSGTDGGFGRFIVRTGCWIILIGIPVGAFVNARNKRKKETK